MVYVHPFDDETVIAGQGTIGLEILADVPEVTDVIVSIGGGGLAGGIASAVKSLKPDVRVWGVETMGAESTVLVLCGGNIGMSDLFDIKLGSVNVTSRNIKQKWVTTLEAK